MAFNSADWTIDYVAKTVTNNDSGTGNNLPAVTGNDTFVGPILEFFQFLATEFANSQQMDDEYPIQSDTPTVYKWLNGWAFGNANDYKYLSGGSIESSDGLEAWANIYSIGQQEAGTQIYVIQNSTEITPFWSTGNIDVLLKVKDAGALIDNGNVLVMARELDHEYDHNFVDLSGLGRNPVGINTANDLAMDGAYGEKYLTVASTTDFDVGNYVEDTTAGGTARINFVDTGNSRIYLMMIEGTFTATNTIQEALTRGGTSTGTTTSITSVTNQIDGYTDISITFGATSQDLNNGSGPRDYDVIIDGAGRSVLEVYQYLKYVTRHNSADTVNGDSGEEYRSADQVLPYTDVKKAPFGTFAGGTLFGARGVWITNTATADISLVDDQNEVQTPPNYQRAFVSNTNLATTQVLVSEITGQGGTFTVPYTVSSVTTNTIVATGAIDINKTPQDGVIRIATPAGRDDLEFTYTGINVSTNTFTGVSPDPSVANVVATDTFATALIAKTAAASTEQSGQVIYASNFWCRAVVRKYGFKPFSIDQEFTSTGLNVSAILTDDPQAS